jgi:mRNA-degrading endonuclease toxin of MazEF toxin-antitoxin module
MTPKNLQQWDIVKVRVRPEDPTGHPAILLSPQEIINADNVNRVTVIYGTTKRPAQSTREGQILLNSADGLEHLTLFDVSQIYTLPKTIIREKLGSISAERRRLLKRIIITTHRLVG